MYLFYFYFFLRRFCHGIDLCVSTQNNITGVSKTVNHGLPVDRVRLSSASLAFCWIFTHWLVIRHWWFGLDDRCYRHWNSVDRRSLLKSSILRKYFLVRFLLEKIWPSLEYNIRSWPSSYLTSSQVESRKKGKTTKSETESNR